MIITGSQLTGCKIDNWIIPSGLVVYMDAANPASYSGSGSTIKNVVTGTGYDIVGTQGVDWAYNTTEYPLPIFEFNNNSTSSTGGIQAEPLATVVNANTLTFNWTVMGTAVPRFYGVGGNETGDSLYLLGSYGGYGSGWRVSSDDYDTPGTAHSLSYRINFSCTAPEPNGGIITRTVTFTKYDLIVWAFVVRPNSQLGFISGYFTYNPLFTPASYINSPDVFAHSTAFGTGGVGSLNGWWANYMIYDRPLSEVEILQNYNTIKFAYGLTQPTV